MKHKPQQSFWQIWNMCFGFLGIQIAFAMQNSHVSRIFETLGAEIDAIPILWIAAPLTGLLVQPVVGYFSDRTWGRFGRRRPYFLAGAVCAMLALLGMPHSGYLWVAALMLWILDAAINVAMEPFRALIGDQLSPAQRPQGYSMQSFFIGIGAVGGSLPYFLEKAGVLNTAAPGAIPDTVRYAFYIAAIVLLLAMSWTIFTTKEYSPEQLAGFEDHQNLHAESARDEQPRHFAGGLLSIATGALFATVIWWGALKSSLYVLAGLFVAGGAAICIAPSLSPNSMLRVIVVDFQNMPQAMRKLASVQFFSWFALFCMWIYMSSAVAQVHFGATDSASAAYNEGGNWAGLLNGFYNGFAALAALVIPLISRKLGVRGTHAFNLLAGAAGFASFLLIKNPDYLIVSMVGVGFAWASILSIPYALLADHLPPKKMGTYMGIFNFFIVIPQLVAASLLGFLIERFFDKQPIYAFAIGATSFVIAAFLSLRVPQLPSQAQS